MVLHLFLAGWGVSCSYMASSEILALSFNKYRNLAFAVAVLGYFTGLIIWPVVSQALLDRFGYHKAMGIMAALHSIHIVAGLLYIPPKEIDVLPDREEGYSPPWLSHLGFPLVAAHNLCLSSCL